MCFVDLAAFVLGVDSEEFRHHGIKKVHGGYLKEVRLRAGGSFLQDTQVDQTENQKEYHTTISRKLKLGSPSARVPMDPTITATKKLIVADVIALALRTGMYFMYE